MFGVLVKIENVADERREWSHMRFSDRRGRGVRIVFAEARNFGFWEEPTSDAPDACGVEATSRGV